ncbi:uncharacterized protein [Macrobrachium rosenbergii]|uniref:uncharacterized protein n=1 Tax=Macrobrachium rosenbergii TaxID=79674 RepID=UPI0034D4760D
MKGDVMCRREMKLDFLDPAVYSIWGDAVCSFTPGFLAKNETPSNPWPHSFTIKNLMDILRTTDQERALCSVRASRHYVERNKRIRGPSHNFWCLVKNPSPLLSKNALAFFMRDVISESHLEI